MTGRTNVLGMDSPQRHSDDATLMTSHEAAVLIGVTIKSLHRWEEQGLISPCRTPGGHRRYRREDVLALIAERSA